MTERDMPQRPRLRAAAPVLGPTVGLVLLLASCGPSNDQNSLHPQGRSAHKILDLFQWPFWVAVVIGVGVLAAVVFIAIRFRERPGNENPKQIHGSTPLEIGWTIVPALILIVLAVPTIATVFDLAKVPKGSDALHIRVVGKQWWWQFQYPDQKIVTADEFHIPAGKTVRLELSACDPTLGTGAASCNVIHSFWIPELAGKQDVVPGRKQALTLKADASQVGKHFLGQCAEYCGLSHARMRMRVYVDSPGEFDAWVQSQQEKPGPVLDKNNKPTGKAQTLLVNFGCTSCHSLDDPSAPSYGPNLSHLASRATFASGAYPLDRTHLEQWVLDAPGMVPMQTKGCPAGQKPGCVGMPSYTKHLPDGQQPMTSDDARTIADYLLQRK